jgi:GDP-L-fucose synthase
MSNFWDGRNVIITGGAGLLGSALIPVLLNAGAKVTATTFRSRHIAAKYWDVVEERQVDLMDVPSGFYDGFTDVFWGAADCAGVKSVVERPSEMIHYNLELSSKNIYAAVKSGVDRFTYMSSSYTYEDSSLPSVDNETWVGDVPVVHYGLGWIKRYMETLCRHHHMTSKTKFVLARPVAYFGPHDTFDLEKCHVVPALIRKAAEKREPFEVWGDGTTERQYTFVRDVAEALILMAERYAVCQPLNVASPKVHTVAELAQTVLEVAGHDVPIKFTGDRSGVINRRVSDVSKLKRLLGYECQTSLAEGVRLTMDWYRMHR